MTTPIAPKSFLDYIHGHSVQFIDRLRDAVKIQSVSNSAANRQDVQAMSDWLKKQLDSFGVTTEQIDLGLDDKGLKLPNAVVGKIGADPKKNTVLVYGHFDVQPAKKEDGWNQDDPFKMVISQTDDPAMYGRGTTDDKGPVLGWLNVLEAFHALNLELPVNLRFCFEGMEENGSQGLDKWIVQEVPKPNGWLSGVDCVCISDNYWLNTTTPCLTYGLRGIVYVDVTVSGPTVDLHSGIYGGMVYEPMPALIKLLDSLVDLDNKINIKGAYAGVPPPGADEVRLYEELHYSIPELEATTGPVVVSDSTAEVLMKRMRWPSLSIHGISGAASDDGTVTVIPHAPTGKFSLRIVPPQTPDNIKKIVTDHLNDTFSTFDTKCKISNIMFRPETGGDAWMTDRNHWSYAAAAKATKDIYGVDPDYTREGGSIPVTLTFAQNIKGPDGKEVNVLLLPMGRGDDGAHSVNEKMNVSNFIEGSKLLGTYLYALANEHQKN